MIIPEIPGMLQDLAEVILSSIYSDETREKAQLLAESEATTYNLETIRKFLDSLEN